MDDSAQQYQSPNFIFRFPSNSLAEKHIDRIANRLQSVLDEALKVLDLVLPDERIQVYLTEIEEAELPSQSPGDDITSQSGRGPRPKLGQGLFVEAMLVPACTSST